MIGVNCSGIAFESGLGVALKAAYLLGFAGYKRGNGKVIEKLVFSKPLIV